MIKYSEVKSKTRSWLNIVKRIAKQDCDKIFRNNSNSIAIKYFETNLVSIKDSETDEKIRLYVYE